MASISKYKTQQGIRWKVSVFVGTDAKTGKKRYKVAGGLKSEAEAKREGKQLERAIADGEIVAEAPKPKPHTFEEVYREWLKLYRLTVRESSYSHTIDAFELHILPAIGKNYIDQFKPSDIQKAVEKWYDETSFYKRYYRHAKRIFKRAIQLNYITADQNPCDDNLIVLPAPKGKQSTKAEFWDRQQLEHFFTCIDPERALHKYVLFRVLAYTGLRIGEAMALEWEDIDFSKKTLDVNKTTSMGLNGKLMVNPPKTKASRRIVPLDNETLNWLKRWRVEQNDYMLVGVYVKPHHQLIFSTKTNNRYRMKVPDDWLRTIIKNNHITPPISLHKFRKSYVSNLLIAGVSVPVVQKLVGHSDPKITLQIYAQVHKEQEVEAANVLADYLKNGSKKGPAGDSQNNEK